MRFKLLAAVAAALCTTTAALAAEIPVTPHVLAGADTDAQVRAYWTPERILSAKSADLTVSGPVRRGHLTRGTSGARQIVPGARPTVDYDYSLATRLYDDAMVPPKAPNGRTPPPLSGTGGVPYTTNRLYPQSDAVLYKVYPYAVVGHLFFTEPGGNYQCSASVIRRNVLATAGHCVNDGSGNYYSNWMFVPSQNGSVAPFGTWTWEAANVSSAWYGGGGGVPNEQDDAIIVLAQQKYKGKKHSLGDLVGYLGYEFNAPLPTLVTQLGYPCNLDSCSDPVATYSADTAGPTNNFQWGSYSYGGASGGPEIQDFGQAPSGVPSEPFGGNILVSSFSYYYTALTPEIDGGSVLYAPGQNGEYTFGDLLNYACGFANAC